METIALFPKEKDSFRNFLNASVCQKFSNDYGSVGALGRAPTGFLCALFMVRLIIDEHFEHLWRTVRGRSMLLQGF